jgi:HD-GYP domain-containing protein (c-di-GMP phosphodiesterase class II)
MKLNTKDKEILEWASVFHDFGKMLMPKEIINKPGKLDPKERKIINLHAELGYELLKNTSITGKKDIDKRIIDLVKNHHNPMENSGDVLCQILSVADIYSALREKRSYKDQMPVEEALDILDQKAKNGEVSTEVVNALREVTETSVAI